MLNFFRYLGLTAAIVLALLVVASVFVQNFWCRYLCPYGALLGAGFPPARWIRRNADLCIDCGNAPGLPAALPVDHLVQSDPPNAPGAWNASRHVPPRAHC